MFKDSAFLLQRLNLKTSENCTYNPCMIALGGLCDPTRCRGVLIGILNTSICYKYPQRRRLQKLCFGALVPSCPKKLSPSQVHPHPATVTIRDLEDYMKVLLYSDYTTITGRGPPNASVLSVGDSHNYGTILAKLYYGT